MFLSVGFVFIVLSCGVMCPVLVSQQMASGSWNAWRGHPRRWLLSSTNCSCVTTGSVRHSGLGIEEPRTAISGRVRVFDKHSTTMGGRTHPRRVPDSGSPISFAKVLVPTLSSAIRTTWQVKHSSSNSAKKHSERLLDKPQTQATEAFMTDGHDEIDARDVHHLDLQVGRTRES